MMWEKTLEDKVINTTEIILQKILKGELKCDTYNLRSNFYEYVVKNKRDLIDALKEYEEKCIQSSKILKDIVEIFKIKIAIYNKYLELLNKRETHKGVLKNEKN